MCGWLKRGDRARLAVEALAQRRVGGELRGQDLDRDRAIEPRVARLVDLAHAAGADGGVDAIRTKGVPASRLTWVGVRIIPAGILKSPLPSRSRARSASLSAPRRVLRQYSDRVRIASQITHVADRRYYRLR